MARRTYYYNYWYERTAPISVKGGIKAQNKRGAFAKKWWGKRWIETLESFNIGSRLSRGRSYARSGQVASLQIGKGEVTAAVQGSSQKAYEVSIKLKKFPVKQWKHLVEKLVEHPIFAARLMGNEMPEEIETVFKEAGLALFPERRNDLETDCSCPDWSNPCKHIAAVYYLLAEAFDNDPFLLFKLRGMDRNEFLDQLRKTGTEAGIEESPNEQREPQYEPVPLPLDQNTFWHGMVDSQELITETPHLPALHAAIPKRLGNLPFWRAEVSFESVQENYYKNTSAACLDRSTEETLE